MIDFHPWSQIAPIGVSLTIRVPKVGPAAASTGIERPPCEEHEWVWTGTGFLRHPVYVVELCVRCWNVRQTLRWDDW